MLNFFKPISNGIARQSVQKRALPHVASHPLKRPCMVLQESVDLVSTDRQPEMKAQPPHEADVTIAPSNGHCKQRAQSHSLATAHQQQPAHQADLVSVDDSHLQDAALGTSVPVIAETVQEEQEQRLNSSINPRVAPVRRFKGVPYAPAAGSIHFLTNMGFTHEQATRALKVTQGNIERAANWLLSGM